MNRNFDASLQKELGDKGRSFFQKYSLLVIGDRGLLRLLKYEMIVLLVSWIPGALGLLFRKIFYPFLFREVGKGVVFGKNMTLRHPHKICIAENTVIDDNVVLDAKGKRNEGIRIGRNVYVGNNTTISCKEGSIYLDDYCNISANCSLLSETEIRIGKYCFLAGQCYLVAGGNHSFKETSIPIMFQPSFSKGGIRIEEDVWLGAGAIVLDGTSIGKGCVIGAGSVVTQSLPAYSIAMGTPARRVRGRQANTQKDKEN